MVVIKMIPVKSSQILSVGYDMKTETLYIEFHNWNVYEYKDVPVDVWQILTSPSTSVGSYFIKEIKPEGRYEYKKIDAKVNNSMLKLQ